MDVNYSTKKRGTGANALSAARVKAAHAAHVCLVFGRETVICREPVKVTFAAVDERHFRAAEAGGSLGQRIQDRLQIEVRTADDLEYIAGRGLVFERLLEIAGALLQLAIGLGAADGDHRLLGEGLHQLHLTVRQPAALSAPEDECANRGAAAYQRDRNARLDRQAPDRKSVV